MFNTLESSARSATQQGGGGHSDAYANSDACFAGSTPVLLPDGSSTPMEQIEEGTLVVGVRGGETTACSVVRVDRHSPRRVVRLETDSASVVVTPNHRFARNGRWVRAGDLAVGDSIACIGAVAGRSLGTSTVTAVFLEPDPVPVFNIVVERPCTFVAGGLVVHSFTWLPRLRALLFGLPGLGGVVSPVPSAG
jgi:hypothetical protein